MLKNMRVFIAFCVFLYPGRKVATSFANITGITTRTVNNYSFVFMLIIFTRLEHEQTTKNFCYKVRIVSTKRKE